MEVARKKNISYKEFMREHWIPGVPLIFANASDIWNLEGKFTPDWLRENFGDRATLVEGEEYTMNEILDLVEGKDTTRPVPYPCKYVIKDQLPEIVEDLTPLHLGYGQPNWLDSKWFKRGNWGNVDELFIGGPGGQFPYIHYDYYHLSAWITQVYGRKEFTIWPKGQEKYLYPDPEAPWKSLVKDYKEPDLDRFPDLAKTTPITVVVEPGETIFVPFGVWHSARSLETSVAVVVDLLNAQNFPLFLKDVWDFRKEGNKLKAAAITCYAAMAGTICKLGDMMGMKRGAYVYRP